MSETRKIAAILVADIVGYSRLAGADEDRTLARLRALRSDLIDPTIAVHHGRVVKRTGDGSLVEFRSVVDAVRCAIEVQNGLIERNAGLPPERRIEFRVGIHLGDVVEESRRRSDGRRRQHRRATGRDRQARRDLSFRGRLSPGERQARPGGHRSRPDAAQEHRKPIRVYSLQVGVPAQAKPATEAKPRRAETAFGARAARARDRRADRRSRPALGISWRQPSRAVTHRAAAPTPRAEAAHLSIVVLPFTNLSGDPAQDYFADGVTENLTTDLSRIRDSFVIARNTAFTYKGKSIDAKEIGKELGVRYVLEGSVQRDQNRVRVNAQLIDAESGAHLWADRFEEDVADLFKLQDQVVARLANALGFELVKAEAEKGARSKSPDAIDLTMRGLALLTKTGHDPLRTRSMRRGRCSNRRSRSTRTTPMRWRAKHSCYVARAFLLCQPRNRLRRQSDRSGRPGHRARSRHHAGVFGEERLPMPFRAALMRLSALPTPVSPSIRTMPRCMHARSTANASLGQFEQAKSDAQQAMRLSPRDPLIGVFHVHSGDAELGLGHFDAAIDEYHNATDSGYRPFFVYNDLAAAYALEGKMDEAKTALAEARRLNPKLTVKWLQSVAPNIPALFEGLRKAGLPEE